MALVHDMGEALTSDIVPLDGISKGSSNPVTQIPKLTFAVEEKHLRERLSLQYLTCPVRPVNPTFAVKSLGFGSNTKKAQCTV